MVFFGGWFANLEYLKSMLIVNLLATIFLGWFFYFFVKKLKLSKNPLLLTIIFLFIPRFLVVRSVGAPESLFILLILLSLYFFEKNHYWLAGFFGGLATATKSPGILLFASYFLTLVERLLKEKKINLNWLGIVLIPLGLLIVFIFFWINYKDFFAYFNTGSFVPIPYPFSVFNFQKIWVKTGWLEDVLFYFFLYGMTVLSLKSVKYRSFFYFSLIFYLAIIFVEHRDISRYSLPLLPLAMIGFDKFFASKKFLIVFLILLPAIILYAVNFLKFNLMPISNWQPFL